MLVNLNNGCSVLFFGCFFSGTRKTIAPAVLVRVAEKKAINQTLKLQFFVFAALFKPTFMSFPSAQRNEFEFQYHALFHRRKGGSDRIHIPRSSISRLRLLFQCEKRRKIRCVSVNKKNHPATLTNALFGRRTHGFN